MFSLFYRTSTVQLICGLIYLIVGVAFHFWDDPVIKVLQTVVFLLSGACFGLVWVNVRREYQERLFHKKWGNQL